MSGYRWYIYRLMPYSDNVLYSLVEDFSFSSQAAAMHWLDNLAVQVGETYLIRRYYRYQAAQQIISLKAES